MKYSHLVAAIGEDNVKTLQGKTVSIVGLGGIGSTVADLMVRSGVNMRIIEKGRVLAEDLDRLSLFGEDDDSKFKATQAKKKLAKINPEVTVKSFNEEITEDTLFLIDSDLVLDCTGNMELTEIISEYCLKQGIPCVSAHVRDTKAIVAASTDKKSAYAALKTLKIERTEGLVPSATHMAAGFMFTKALKLLTGEKLKRGVVIFDVWGQHFEDKKGNKK